MADQGFPSQHTTSTSATHNTNVRFDPSYFRTLGGMLKVTQIALNLLGFVCVESSMHSAAGTGIFYNLVAMGGFWFTAIMLAMYLFHVIEKLYCVPWPKVECAFCSAWTAIYLIAACMAATFGLKAYAAASFFGFCACVTYGYDAFLKYRAAKSGTLDQGVKVVTKETTTPANA